MSAAAPKHILAGDDSPAILDLLREILEAEGHRVSVSTDALDLPTIKRVDPDVVVLDHMVDDGDRSGWRLIQQIRDDPQTAALPIVVCTGAVHRVRQQASLLERLGVDVVLKPFDIDHLVATVDRSSFDRALAEPVGARTG